MVLGSNLARDKRLFSSLGQSSVVHIVTVLLAGRSWVNLGRDKRFFSYLRQGSVVHIVTILLAGWFWVQMLVGTNVFSLI